MLLGLLSLLIRHTAASDEAIVTETRHYSALDGLRGIAAVAVVVFHSRIFFGTFRPDSAYLAVDFFFVLSGFVLAHAYDAQLGMKLSPGKFFQKRIIRLLPLYYAGCAVTIVTAAAAMLVLHDTSHWTVKTLLISVPFAVLMVPAQVNACLFPLNVPSWSLFYELLANGIYGTRIWHGRRLIWIVPAIAAIGLLVEAITCGSVDQGAEWGTPAWSTLAWGTLRVAYSFPVGLLIYRYRHVIRMPRVPVVVLAFLLAALLWVDLPGVWRIIFDLLFVLLISPAIVVVGCYSAPRSARDVALCSFLGAISYPIYALHQPVMSLINGLNGLILHGPVKPEWQPWIGLLVLAALVAVAATADKVDLRVRRALIRRCQTSPAGSPEVAV
jgi:peptidoglycan/LPS O-acetylase OafA/YrhL